MIEGIWLKYIQPFAMLKPNRFAILASHVLSYKGSLCAVKYKVFCREYVCLIRKINVRKKVSVYLRISQHFYH